MGYGPQETIAGFTLGYASSLVVVGDRLRKRGAARQRATAKNAGQVRRHTRVSSAAAGRRRT